MRLHNLMKASWWLVVVGSLGVAGWLLTQSAPSSIPTALAAPQSPEISAAVDLETYTRIQALRDEMSLNNLDLASVGCSDAQARQLIAAVRVWHDQNIANLDHSDTEVAAAQAGLEDLFHQINFGPKNEAVFATLQTEVTALESARQRRRELLENAAAVAGAALRSEQSQLLAQVRLNRGVPERYRYLVLDPSTRGKLSSIYDVSKVDIALESQAAAKIQQIEALRQQSMDAILVAEAQVLPAPPELQFNPTEESISGSKIVR